LKYCAFLALAGFFLFTAPAINASKGEVQSPLGQAGAIRAQQIAMNVRRQAWRGYIESGRSYVPLELPFAVSDKETNRWRRMLSLSEPQSAILDSFLKEYHENWKSLGLSDIAPLWILSAEVAECDGTLPEAECASKSDSLERRQDVVAAKLIALDRVLLDRLAAILPESQLTAWQRAESFRMRERCRDLKHHHQSAAIDLSDLLDHMEIEGALHVKDQAAFLAALIRYEEELTVALLQLKRSLHDALPAGRRIGMAVEQGLDARAATSRYQSRWDAVRADEERLVGINRHHVAMLADLLEPSSAVLLTSWFEESSYPEIRTSRPDAKALVTVVAKHMDDNPAMETLTRLSEELNQELAVLERSMMSLYDKFWFESIGKHPQSLKPQFDSELAALMGTRQRMASDFVATLRSIVPSGNAEIQEALDQFVGAGKQAVVDATPVGRGLPTQP